VRDWAAGLSQQVARLQRLPNSPQVRNDIRRDAEGAVRWWEKLRATKRRCTLAFAQAFVARSHGFLSWPKFLRHLQELKAAKSAVSQFEAAADAIVNGDLRALEKLLRRNPALVFARSTRDHRSTLLHYVSANGIEDFRQKTPKNVVAITRLLLDAGSDVNAESDAYGGRSTTLGLAATSCHPADAGVQIPLLELLISRGAMIDGPDSGSAIVGCLHNGRLEAAEFLASRGARMNLEGAAGIGRLDVVKTFFDERGKRKRGATAKDLTAGFLSACGYGQTPVAEFLLSVFKRNGSPLPDSGGETGLHWAAIGGHPRIVKLLLDAGAPVDVRDKTHHSTPLEWALYEWGNRKAGSRRKPFHEVVALLVRAGAKLHPQWYAHDPRRRKAAERMISRTDFSLSSRVTPRSRSKAPSARQ
jgi:ankyrin repeat protein